MMTNARARQIGAFAWGLLLAFALDPLFTSTVAQLPQPVVAAAHLITPIGNSAWLGILLPVIAISAALTQYHSQSANARLCAKLTLRLSVALFLSILLSGIAVQLLKHSFGRARPELFAQLGAYDWRPYGFSFSFNSFPSGHATTMGALAWFLCWLLPGQRVAILTAGALIAMTRVVTGHHYPSDVVAGFGLGVATSWLMIRALLITGQIPFRHDPIFARIRSRTAMRLERIAKSLSCATWTHDPRYLSLLIGILIAMNAAMMIFVAAPQIDIAASDLFYDVQHGFSLADDPALGVLRIFLLRATQIAAACALILYLLWCRLDQRLCIPRAIPAYATACFALGPALLVNGIFKTYWGRARPADIQAFGGERLFSLPFARADQCLSNCSFPSGEGAAIAMLAIVAGSLTWPWLRRRPRVLAGAAGAACFGIGLRVAMGRHFLSDSIFAVLMMGLVALILWRWCAVRQHRAALTTEAIAADGVAIRRYLAAGPGTAPSLSHDLRTVALALRQVLVTTVTLLRATAIGTAVQIPAILPRRIGPLWFRHGE